MPHLIEVKDVYKIYNPGENEVRALDGVSLTIDQGSLSPSLARPAPENPP